MDEIHRLENQIKQLQEELEKQNKEAAKMRQRLSDENLRRLKEYEREMQSNLDQHDRDVQMEYERLLNEYQRSVNAEIQEQQLAMDVEYQKLLATTQAKEREWIEKSQQLESLITELKKSTQEKDQISAQESDKYMLEAGMAYKEVEKKPHEKFFPKRIKPFHTAICEARTLAKSGLNEAAIAIYISTRSGLNRLGFDVDEQYDEWIRQYSIFKNKVGLLHIQTTDELAFWVNMSANKTVKTDDLSEAEKNEARIQINYWSTGEYGNICKRLSEFAKEISEVEKTSPTEYLKREDSYDIDVLKKSITELDEMLGKFKDLSVLYKERYNASCERADWGELIIDFFEGEINLEWLEEETHFKDAEADVLVAVDYEQYMQHIYGQEYDKVDAREWLELVFQNSQETDIYIYIVPYEKGTHVENRVVLYIDYSGAVNDDYSRTIYAHIMESIRLEEDNGVINFTTDINELKTNMNTTLRETGQSISKKMQRIR
ncbi:MAG: hypothetical protein K2G45_02385 [Lachnospiraceae bacterium]|nr:hypothetical protein [Lachnospiraceae bacterium]